MDFLVQMKSLQVHFEMNEQSTYAVERSKSFHPWWLIHSLVPKICQCWEPDNMRWSKPKSPIDWGFFSWSSKRGISYSRVVNSVGIHHCDLLRHIPTDNLKMWAPVLIHVWVLLQLVQFATLLLESGQSHRIVELAKGSAVIMMLDWLWITKISSMIHH